MKLLARLIGAAWRRAAHSPADLGQRTESMALLRERVREVGKDHAHHVFISYAQHPDKATAQRLRDRLHRIGSRWWERRHMRVFLDLHSIPNSPSLPGEIRSGLTGAAGLAVLANPQSKGSRWVLEEVRAWWDLGRQPPMIVRTGGVIEWDHEAGDFDWKRTTALHREGFANRFTDVPLWSDLTLDPDVAWWRRHRDRAKRTEQVSVAIAAAVLGLKPEVVATHERRRQRRQWTLAAVAAATVCGLTVTSVLYARTAEREALRKAGEQVARNAATPGMRTDLSLLLYAAAHTVTPRQAGGLWEAALRHPGLRRVMLMPSDVTVGSVDGVAFSADGRWLAGATSVTGRVDGKRTPAVVVWRGDGGGPGVPVTVHTAGSVAATAVAFSPDSRVLAVGDSSGSVTLMRAPEDGAGQDAWRDASILAMLTAPDEVRRGPEPDRLSFTPDGRRLAVSHVGGVATVWHWAAGVVHTTVLGARGMFAPRGGTFASVTTGADVVIREADGLTARTSIRVDGATDIVYSDDGMRLAVSTPSHLGGVWFVDVGTAAVVPVRAALPSSVLAFSGSALLASEFGTLRLDMSGQVPAAMNRSVAMMARAVAFQPGRPVYAVAGHWVDRSLDGAVVLWDAAADDGRLHGPPPSDLDKTTVPVLTGDVPVMVAVTNGLPVGATLAPGVAAPTTVTQSADGVLVAGVNGRNLTLWTVRDGTAHSTTLASRGLTASPDGRPPAGLAFSPDRRWLAVTRPDGRIAVMTMLGDQLSPVAELDSGAVPSDLAFRPDGSELVAATSAGVHAWRAGTWDLRMVTPPASPTPLARVTALVFDDSARLYVTDGRTVQRWEPARGKAVNVPNPDPGAYPLSRLAVDPQGTVLAGWHRGGGIVLWDLAANRRLGPVLAAPVPLTTMRFTPDGSVLITSGRSVKYWEFDPRRLLEWTCHITQRGLDPQEWQTYGAGELPLPSGCPPR